MIDPTAGTVTETARDDRPVEFPTLDDRRIGRRSRHLYAVSESAVVHYDEAGPVTAHELGPDVLAGEAVFVPATDDAAEDEGWLLTITTRRDGSASQLLVLDAGDVAGPPVATVHAATRGAGRLPRLLDPRPLLTHTPPSPAPPDVLRLRPGRAAGAPLHQRQRAQLALQVPLQVRGHQPAGVPPSRRSRPVGARPVPVQQRVEQRERLRGTG